ncbi:hypothetical protein Cgig2_018838 [Carnegiea gigantea]|uniref:Uncharacterized protein n=1 Tax=Carnegiea gigantea TaxID=171969 RepID=A0A9Q1KH29_9CARY|nr:hypothetical protein Cgig2_018838 [Carnegiea gigantea]
MTVLCQQFGDASGIQSPVSFGGFGSLTRHLERLSTGIFEACEGGFLDSPSLSLLNPYLTMHLQPNLSASWLFQRAMSAKELLHVPPSFINELLYTNFRSMEKLGDPVLRPFLQVILCFNALTISSIRVRPQSHSHYEAYLRQDVVQFGPLVKTLGLVMITKPQLLPFIFKQIN